MGHRLSVVAALFVAILSGCASMPAPAESKAVDAGPYVPTPQGIADTMLTLARIGPDDYLIDLGSGDGRLVIGAVAKHKAKGATGIEIKPDLVAQSEQRAKEAGVGDRVTFIAGDLFAAKIGHATIVTAYLLPHIMGDVEKKLARELKPGARVVVHDYPLPTWKAEEIVTFEAAEKAAISGSTRTVLYLYRVPKP